MKKTLFAAGLLALGLGGTLVAQNALHDVEALCLNLWRGITRTLTA